MHRNLGVHIAKVKSVNLDTWTQEQVRGWEIYLPLPLYIYLERGSEKEMGDIGRERERGESEVSQPGHLDTGGRSR